MKKKILTLLVLLMTAVTGAWATDYYVVGTMTNWQKNDQYKMTLNASAATTEYQLGIALAATDEFKVIGVDGDNPWAWYPSGDNYGQNGELTADGLYTIYFRPNGDGGSDWFYNCIYVADGVNLTADGEAWTLAQMPACNVELEVEYFALATLATQPAAAEGVVEGTDAALLTPGTSAEGTLAYAIGTSEAPTGQWSDAIPTAQDLEAGTCYVWYKVVGDAEHSDSQPQSIAVTIAEAPTYAVTIDDAGVDASNWQATPAEPKTGQTVTLSYSGKKKIKSITIEAAPVPAATVTTAPTAKTGVKAGEDVAIVNEGAAEGGTMMYMVNATQPASTDGFSATVPTAEGLTAGTYYVWYYVKADDSHTDSEISATGIEVTIAAPTPAATVTTAPTAKGNLHAGLIIPLVTEGVADGGTMMYAVTTDNTQPASTDGFSATVPTAEGLTEACTRYVWYYVKADDTHTDSEISATGIEVTIAEPVEPTLANALNTAGMTVKVNYNYSGDDIYCLFVSNGNGTYTFHSGGGYVPNHWGNALVVEDGKLVFKQNAYPDIATSWNDFGYSVTFDTSNNTYRQWAGGEAESRYNPSFISVEVNGTEISLTSADPVVTTVTWNFSGMSESIELEDGYENDGVTLQGDGTLDCNRGALMLRGDCTFTNTLGKNFKKIVISAEMANIQGWSFNPINRTATWEGTSSSVTIGGDSGIDGMTSIEFYLVDE